MPRLKARPKRGDKLVVLISGNAALKRKSSDELAEMAGIGLSTYYERIRDPESFRLSELRGLCKGLGIPIDDFRQSIQF